MLLQIYTCTSVDFRSCSSKCTSARKYLLIYRCQRVQLYVCGRSYAMWLHRCDCSYLPSIFDLLARLHLNLVCRGICTTCQLYPLTNKQMCLMCLTSDICFAQTNAIFSSSSCKCRWAHRYVLQVLSIAFTCRPENICQVLYLANYT